MSTLDQSIGSRARQKVREGVSFIDNILCNQNNKSSSNSHLGMPPPHLPQQCLPQCSSRALIIFNKSCFKMKLMWMCFYYRANVPSDPRAAQMKVACMKLYQGIADMIIVEAQDPKCPDVWK